MTDSPNANEIKSSSRGGTLFATWRAIDPIYVWSALVGLVVALLLIGIGIAMETRALQ
jgi:hypothetical protein